MANHKYISFRAPAELVEAIDRMARHESERTGLPVDRSGIVRRALERDLARLQEQAKPKKETKVVEG
jgi:hypothetical protein